MTDGSRSGFLNLGTEPFGIILCSRGLSWALCYFAACLAASPASIYQTPLSHLLSSQASPNVPWEAKPLPGEIWLRTPQKKRDAGRRSGRAGPQPTVSAPPLREDVLRSHHSHMLLSPSCSCQVPFSCFTSPWPLHFLPSHTCTTPSSSGGSTGALSASGVLASPLNSSGLDLSLRTVW